MSKLNLEQIRTLPLLAKGTVQNVYRDKRFVYKEISASTYGLDPKKIVSDIEEFYAACKVAGVPVPRVADIPYVIDEDILVNRYSYEGEPFSQSVSPKVFLGLYTQVILAVHNGLQHGIGLSSFNEQYVVDHRKRVTFVDFFVPATLTGFIHYKKGDDALNYYVVQFSENSAVLSSHTHYWLTFPEFRQVIEPAFEAFMRAEGDNYPLAVGVLNSPAYRWFLENYAELNKGSKWVAIRANTVCCQANSIADILHTTSPSDLVANLARQRVFTVDELVSSRQTFKKLYD